MTLFSWSYSYLYVKFQLSGCHFVKAFVVVLLESQPKMAVSFPMEGGGGFTYVVRRPEGPQQLDVG